MSRTNRARFTPLPSIDVKTILEDVYHTVPTDEIVKLWDGVTTFSEFEARSDQMERESTLYSTEQILVERSSIDTGIWLVRLISVVAPLLGLFGTITGMINTFQAITLFGTGDPKTMANGISEALVTTMLGLMTAIPATFMAAIMANYAKNILTVLEEQSTGMIAAASEENKI